jgi:hypothetical protein
MLKCKHCEHDCHCKSLDDCYVEKCSCKICDHNALDEFHNRLTEGFKEIS